jgi:hypothetical protein
MRELTLPFPLCEKRKNDQLSLFDLTRKVILPGVEGRCFA